MTQGRPLASIRDVRHSGLLKRRIERWCDDVWASFALMGNHPRKMTTSSAGQFTQRWVTRDLSQFGSRFQTSVYPGTHPGKSAPPYFLALMGLRANERRCNGLTLEAGRKGRGIDES
jgi:hypothetical protein